MSAESKLINPSMQSVCTLFDEHDQMYSMSVMCHIFLCLCVPGLILIMGDAGLLFIFYWAVAANYVPQGS